MAEGAHGCQEGGGLLLYVVYDARQSVNGICVRLSVCAGRTSCHRVLATAERTHSLSLQMVLMQPPTHTDIHTWRPWAGRICAQMRSLQSQEECPNMHSSSFQLKQMVETLTASWSVNAELVLWTAAGKKLTKTILSMFMFAYIYFIIMCILCF